VPKNSIADDNHYLPFIDGLRGIAILMVVWFHLSGRHHDVDYGPFLNTFIDQAALGVQLFFVISAFTLFHASGARFRTDRFPKLSFYIRRMFRILPFWWIMVFVYARLGGIHDVSRILENIFLYFGFTRYHYALDLIPVGWTIFVEETFYAMMPFLLAHVTGLAAAFRFWLATMLIAVSWKFVATSLQLPTANHFLIAFPLAHWWTFAIGIIIYFIFKDHRPAVEAFFRKWWSLVLFGLFLAYALLGNAMLWTSVALACLVPASFAGHGTIGKIARHPLLMRFGGYCYSIYLLHWIIIDALRPAQDWVFGAINLGRYALELRLVLWFPVVAAVCLGCGWAAFTFIEKPCVNLGKLTVKGVSAWLASRPPARQLAMVRVIESEEELRVNK